MNVSQEMTVNQSEQEHLVASVELIAPNGLGFGEGGISVKNQLEQGIITPEAPKRIHEILIHDPNVFKQVEATDDGCGDGRPWSKIVQMVASENGEKKIHFFKTSQLRAKVFGGGLVAASSMWRVLQGVPESGETIKADRQFVASEFAKREFSHGAHSDDHAEGDKCGCGAIDNYPLITANALKYRAQVMSTLEVLYAEDFDENKAAIESAFGVYEALAGSADYFNDANGKDAMQQLLEAGAVVKELSGNHVEETIVINDVPGTTLDQRYFTEQVKNACIEEIKPQVIQAFSVDVWRGKEIAKEVVSIASEHDSAIDTAEAYKLAYADFLIRTLAVSATLTGGDLPVYARKN